MAYSSINESEAQPARGTNNVIYCPRMLHVADAIQDASATCRCNPGMQQLSMYNIASKTLQVQHPGSNLYMYMYQTIDWIHNAINIKETYKLYNESAIFS